MGIGASAFLLAVGEVLTFAADHPVSGVDHHVIGLILMAAGLIGLFAATVIFGGRRDEVITERVTRGPRP